MDNLAIMCKVNHYTTGRKSGKSVGLFVAPACAPEHPKVQF